MSRLQIVYGTLTGNTQLVAEQIQQSLQIKLPSWQVTLHCFEEYTEIQASQLRPGDCLLLGSSTWDEGSMLIEVAKAIKKLTTKKLQLPGVLFATFGCGDSSYGEHFCTSVDVLAQQCLQWHMQPITDGLKIDGFPELKLNQKATQSWVNAIAAKLTH